MKEVSGRRVVDQEESYPDLAPRLATACDFVVYHKSLRPSPALEVSLTDGCSERDGVPVDADLEGVVGHDGLGVVRRPLADEDVIAGA